MRPPSPLLVALALLPLDVWLFLRLRDAIGLKRTVLALVALGFAVAWAMPTGGLLARWFPAWGARRRERSLRWSAIGVVLVPAAFFAPAPGARLFAGLVATRMARVGIAHWRASVAAATRKRQEAATPPGSQWASPRFGKS